MKLSVYVSWSLAANGYVYGVVWRFEERTCQTVTPFIRCNALEFSTIRQMHYTRC